MIWLGAFMALVASLANNTHMMFIGLFIAVIGVIIEIR